MENNKDYNKDKNKDIPQSPKIPVKTAEQIKEEALKKSLTPKNAKLDIPVPGAKNILVFNKFEIPDKFLSQLNEFSNGGFILFAIDANGCPKIYSRFDSDVHSISLTTVVKNYGNAMDQLQSEMTLMNLIDPEALEDGEGLDEDDDLGEDA